MGKPVLILFTLLAVVISSNKAQYYYRDIVSNKQALREQQELKDQKIRTIKVHSFEGNGVASEGFFCEKNISKDYRKMETFTRSYVSGKSLLTAYYDDNNLLVRSSDSSDLSVASSFYKYDSKGNISSIVFRSHSNDDDFATALNEEHLYFYNNAGQPIKMLRTRNKKDSATIVFKLDEHGNVVDELEQGKDGYRYYYYYNDKNRLTDIVKFNVVKNKLLPDFMFEYNSAGQVTQMISTEEGANSNYYTWKYVYNDGLRIIEKCFSKEKNLLGYFEYEYE